MKNLLTLIILFLFTYNSYGANLTKPMVVDYDFDQQLLKFKIENTGESYWIEVSSCTYNECSKENKVLDSFVKENYDGSYINYTTLPGKFYIAFYKYNNGKGALVSNREVFVSATSSKFKVEWCYPEQASKFRVYQKENPEEEYQVSSRIETTLKNLEKEVNLLDKKFVVVTAVSNGIESLVSNELIFYNALPLKPENIHIE